jgi:hypothetical protein
MDGLGNSAAIQQSKPFAYQDFDLGSAIVNRRLDIPGENLYCDQYSTGTASIRMNAQNNIESAPILVASGTQINGKFVSFVLDSPAQAGKVLRLIIGAPNYFIKPASSSQANPGVITILDAPGVNTEYRAIGAASLAFGAADVVTLVTPAQNPNGVILREFAMQVQAGAGASASVLSMLLACTGAAPTTQNSRTNAIQLAEAAAINSAIGANANFNMQRRLPAAWGIYFVTQAAAINALQSVLRVSLEIL